MGTKNDLTLINQFGEESINQVVSIDEAFSDKQPAKTSVTAVTLIPSPTIATTEDCAEKINELITALKAVN